MLIREIEANTGKIAENTVRVQTITDLITDTGLANSFQKREKMLRMSAGIWLAIFIIALGLLGWAVMHLFKDFQKIPELTVVIYRLTLTSPLWFLVGVALKQYGNERNLNERYAFKATIAAVIKNHADFLVGIDEKVNTENSKIIRDTLEDVYSEPYGDRFHLKDIKSELEVILEDKKDKKKQKAVDFIELAKELKVVIPDNETLKIVVELFSKLNK